MFSIRRVLIGIALLTGIGIVGTGAPATAAVVSADDPRFGPGSITIDLVTGYHWLDVTLSANRSIADVSAQLGPGGDFAGFRIATQAEVTQFFQDAGLGIGFNFPSAPYQAFTGLIGLTSPSTNPQRTVGRVSTQSSPGQYFAPDVGTFLPASGTSGFANPNNCCAAATQANPDAGVFLVRTVVSTDDPRFGPGSITIDLATGDQWLDVTLSANRSIADVSAQLGPGGDFAGFRIATQAEVTQFFQNAGLGIGFNFPSAPYQVFTGLIGLTSPATNPQRTVGRVSTQSSPGQYFAPDVGTFIPASGTSGFANPNNCCAAATQANPDAGVWLVRSVPIAYWPGDGSAADVAGGHNGVLTNGATFAPGRVGSAFSFDGIDDYVTVPDAPDLAFGTNDFTVSFWVNFNDLTSHDNGLIHKDSYSGTSTYNGWLFDICEPCEGGGGVGFLTRNIVGDVGPFTFVAYSTANLQVGQWYHIAGVRQANVLYLYVNGVLRASAAEPAPTDVSNSIDLRFGSLSPASPQFFNGLLDEITIYDRALTAAEITSFAGFSVQTITFGPLSSRVFGDLPFTVNATASSGLSVSFSTAGNCSVSGNSITITGSGSCTVTASQAGNADYLPAESVAQSFTIARATTTVAVVADPNPSNTGQSVTITATVSSGVGTPTSSVTFKDGDSVLGNSPLVAGQATLSTTTLTTGLHSIGAEYGGDTNYLPSASSAFTQTVLTTGRDLVEIAVSTPPPAIAPGGAFSATDTVLNQGQVAAGASTTRYYLSANGSAKTKLLTGTRPVPGLSPGASSAGTATVTVPGNTVLGQYYLLACADDTTNFSESNETNNCRASAATVQVTRADLLATTVSFTPSVLLPGGTLTVMDTVLNQGLVDAGASTTRYYLSADTAKDASDRLLNGTRAVPALGPNGTSSGTIDVTVPANMPLGTYSVLACADDTTTVTETNETNNCVASGSVVRIGRPDLRESAVSDPPAVAIPGTSFAVTDTAQNQGDLPAAATITRYYLSSDQLRNAGDQLLTGTRSVPALASSQMSTDTVTVTIPTGTALGAYYLLACADDQAPKITEGDETNNCTASAATVQVTRPDLVQTAVGAPPLAAPLRSSFTVSDTVGNQSLVGAGATTTRYYLSVDGVRDSADKRLTGTRAVPALGPGETSTGPASLTIPANTMPGTYFLIACADDTTSVQEINEANNCAASGQTITVTP